MTTEAAMATSVALTGLSETMLWTLHGRAGEAARPDAFLHDPECLRVSLDRLRLRPSLRPVGPRVAVRAKAFDDTIRPWLKQHQGGAVVELTAGLETGFFRCDDGTVRWLCVDMPKAVAVRERFLPSTDRHRSLADSTLDFSWFDEIDSSRGVFVSAQGVFVYFERHQVQRLCSAAMTHFPSVVLMFDTMPAGSPAERTWAWRSPSTATHRRCRGESTPGSSPSWSAAGVRRSPKSRSPRAVIAAHRRGPRSRQAASTGGSDAQHRHRSTRERT